MPFAHTSGKKRWRIFIMPVLPIKFFTKGDYKFHLLKERGSFSDCKRQSEIHLGRGMTPN
jgi:hypothetical protein